MSTGLTPLRRHQAFDNVLRALAVLIALGLAGLVVLVLLDRGANTSSRPVGTGSGVAASQVRSLPAFTSLDLTAANNVVVRVGARQSSVTVHADSNLLRRVTTQVSSGRLLIGSTPGTLTARSPMFVAVGVPSLTAVTVQGSGNISVTGVNGPSLTLGIPGSGTIHVAGTTARLGVTIGGSGTALLSRLNARDTTASITGSGIIVIRATHSLDATISGSGTIFYTGNPARVTKSVTGSGTISSQ